MSDQPVEPEEDTTISIVVGFTCRTQDEAARVIESISRPITGLVLDGVSVSIMDGDNNPYS